MNKTLQKILEPLEGHLKKVDEIIALRLKTGIPILDESASHLFRRGGKKIRASLVLLTSGLKGAVPPGVVDLAAAVEIVHAASLIHDDIIDQSFLRRGGITVPRQWGNKVSVLVGDFMYSLALTAAVDDGTPELFPLMVNGTKDMVQGELYQLQYSTIDAITEEHYLRIIELKTARFMAFSSQLGGVKAGFGVQDRQLLYDFGLNLGFTFQIVDDMLDILESDATGKDMGNDLKDGKITLPFLFYIREKGDAARALINDFLEKKDPGTWEAIRRELRGCGALDYTIGMARAYRDKAIRIMKGFPDSEYKMILLELADFLIQRTY